MRLLVSLLDGKSKVGEVSEDDLVADLAQRVEVPIDCCLTLAGVPLEGDRSLAEYGITHGMDLEVERLTGESTKTRTAHLLDKEGQLLKEPPDSCKLKDHGGKGRAATGKGTDMDAFISAARNGEVETVEAMIEAGQDVNQVCIFTNLTALSAAASGGHEALVKGLIQLRARVNALEGSGELPPIHAAAARGSESSILALLRSRADVDAVEEVLGQTALHAAIDRKQAGSLKLLLMKGANINAETKDGVTPFGHACAKGDIECVQTLMSNKASMRTESTKGISPLGSAANKGHIHVVQALLDARVQVDSCALYGALKTENEDLEELLLDYGASTTSGSLEGRVALHHAAGEGNLELCAYLADQGADVNVQDRAGVTPLMLSAQNGSKGTTRLLLAREADVDITDRSGNTALHYAGWFEKPKVFDILIKVGEADPEMLNKAGEKPRSPNPGEKCVIM